MKIITIESKEAGTCDADRLARLIFNVLTGTRFYDWGAGSSDQILSRPVPNFLSADYLVNQHTVEVVIPCPTKCMVLVPPSLKLWAGEMRNRINQQIGSMFRMAPRSSTRSLVVVDVGPEPGSPFTVRDRWRENEFSAEQLRRNDEALTPDSQWIWVFLDEFERDFLRHAGDNPIMNDVASILINREHLAPPVPEEAHWPDMRWRFTVSEDAPDSLNSHYVARRGGAQMVPALHASYSFDTLYFWGRRLHSMWAGRFTSPEQVVANPRRSRDLPVLTVPRDKFTISLKKHKWFTRHFGGMLRDGVKERCLICYARIHDTCWALCCALDKSGDSLLQICDACEVRERGGSLGNHLRRVKCADPAPHLRKETLQILRLDRKMRQWPAVSAVRCGDRRGLIRRSWRSPVNTTAFMKLWGDTPAGRVAQICEWLGTGAGPLLKLEDWSSHASVEFCN